MKKHHDKDHHHPIPSHLGVSENSVPLNPMVLLIIIPTKWLFHWDIPYFHHHHHHHDEKHHDKH